MRAEESYDDCRVRVECGSFCFEQVEEAGSPATRSFPNSVLAKVLFVPARETLTMFEGFVSAYENQKLSFDETYYDICRELNQAELRAPPDALLGVLTELESIIGGPVRLNIDSFVVDTKIGALKASMVAEGHRKLAALAYLIKNGALSAESTLFWDEPEANLNPTLIAIVARVIRTLAKAGVQIFVATHDYLLARELSIAAEYKDPPVVETMFIGLHRGSDAGAVEVESGAYLSDIRENPIVNAYSTHYEREEGLFAAARPGEES